MIKAFFVTGTCIVLLSGCNIYSPLTTHSNDTDYEEAALKCLHEGDLKCAAEYYGKLSSDHPIKNQKLCTTHLSIAGFKLSVLFDIVNKIGSSGKMLGTLAGALLPWTADKAAASDSAKEICGAVADDIGIFLNTISLFVHCATLISKADQYVATSESDMECTTAGDNDGTITGVDVSDNTDGTIGAKGMCSADVVACRDDILGLSSSGLEQAGLTDLKTAFEGLPDALKNSTAATSVVRSALRGTIE